MTGAAGCSLSGAGDGSFSGAEAWSLAAGISSFTGAGVAVGDDALDAAGGSFTGSGVAVGDGALDTPAGCSFTGSGVAVGDGALDTAGGVLEGAGGALEGAGGGMGRERRPSAVGSSSMTSASETSSMLGSRDLKGGLGTARGAGRVAGCEGLAAAVGPRLAFGEDCGFFTASAAAGVPAGALLTPALAAGVEIPLPTAVGRAGAGDDTFFVAGSTLPARGEPAVPVLVCGGMLDRRGGAVGMARSPPPGEG